MNPAEIELNTLSIHIIHKLADFFCHRNGSVIVRFVEENGLMCGTEQMDQLSNCFDLTFQKYKPSKADANTTTTSYPETAAALCT